MTSVSQLHLAERVQSLCNSLHFCHGWQQISSPLAPLTQVHFVYTPTASGDWSVHLLECSYTAFIQTRAMLGITLDTCSFLSFKDHNLLPFALFVTSLSTLEFSAVSTLVHVFIIIRSRIDTVIPFSLDFPRFVFHLCNWRYMRLQFNIPLLSQFYHHNLNNTTGFLSLYAFTENPLSGLEGIMVSALSHRPLHFSNCLDFLGPHNSY